MCLLLFWGSQLNAQTTQHHRIVWLKNPNQSVESLVRDFETAHEIYAPMGLWEISPEINRTENTATIADIYWENLKEVRYTGPNRVVTKRVAPNDAFYGNQPYLGHIGMESVWNYQNNGVNRFGDTLVIAYIDDGADTSHPDLIGNLYINRKEIPWNGVDDDSNGYIDDYQGWNSGEQSPAVFSSVSVLDGHGTNVAGVMGAKGNNNLGVTGVNWHIKMLPINCYPDNLLNVEAAVLRGMVYAFKQKQLFLTSNKVQGINIVALNMSLGIDNAFPSDAEMWCTLFDSLGSVGIWSYNATTNRNIDVGINGDIPTLCESRYLISVNVSTINDQHYSSGFSDSFVDIAAPGVNIYTTMPVQFNGVKPYVSETGTSFASPVVAGISALIESIACRAYLDLKETEPERAIELWRSWLKSSVTTSASLKTKTAWGGRVNAEQLRKQMSDWCVLNDSSFSQIALIGDVEVFNIDPNPSGSRVWIESKSRGTITLYDRLGRKCKEVIVEHGRHEMSFEEVQGLFLIVFDGELGGRSQKVHFFSDR